MLDTCNKREGIKEFVKAFKVKDAIWSAAKSWDNVPKDILINGWHKLWPSTLFLDGEDDDEADFCGFRVSDEKEIVKNLLEYTKGMSCEVAKLLDEEAIQECMNIDSDAPVVLQLTDSEIVDMVMNADKNKSDESDDGNDGDSALKEEEKVSTDRCISLTEELIRGMEQKSFISEQHIMWMYKIEDVFIKEKPKYMKQQNLQDMFAKINQKISSEVQPEPQPSTSNTKLSSEVQPEPQPSISNTKLSSEVQLQPSTSNTCAASLPVI